MRSVRSGSISASSRAIEAHEGSVTLEHVPQLRCACRAASPTAASTGPAPPARCSNRRGRRCAGPRRATGCCRGGSRRAGASVVTSPRLANASSTIASAVRAASRRLSARASVTMSPSSNRCKRPMAVGGGVEPAARLKRCSRSPPRAGARRNGRATQHRRVVQLGAMAGATRIDAQAEHRIAVRPAANVGGSPQRCNPAVGWPSSGGSGSGAITGISSAASCSAK